MTDKFTKKTAVDTFKNSTSVRKAVMAMRNRVRNSFYKISKKLNIGLLFYLLICYNSIKEVIIND